MQYLALFSSPYEFDKEFTILDLVKFLVIENFEEFGTHWGWYFQNPKINPQPQGIYVRSPELASMITLRFGIGFSSVDSKNNYISRETLP